MDVEGRARFGQYAKYVIQLIIIGDAGVTWENISVLRLMLVGIFSDDCFVLPPGGNNPAGVLGQVGGLLELAEQIQRQEVPDPDGIFLPIGSSCTITGLIIGVALCRHLDLPVFKPKPSPSTEYQFTTS